VKRVLRFKYATWNIRGLGEKEEELDKILNENNIKLSVITESKKKLQGTEETEHYTVIYSGVGRHVRGLSGVMIWIHKSISNKTDHYKFWNDRIIETRLKTQKGHLTILGIYPCLYRVCCEGNVPDFGRLFLKLKYADLTKNTYIRS